jgi:hypothetical protein
MGSSISDDLERVQKEAAMAFIAWEFDENRRQSYSE